MADLGSNELSGLVIIGSCIAASSFFSASETAITALGHLKARHLVEQRKGRRSKHLHLWLNHPARVLATILIFNNVFNILASAQATVLATKFFGNQAVGIATGTVTLLVLVFGEIMPKSIARYHFELLSDFSLHIIRFLYIVFFPLVWLLSELATILIKFSGVESKNPTITEDEIEFLINEGEKAGVIEDTKKDMISGVFEFDETKVREIMTPRTDIVAVSKDEGTFEDAIQLTLESGHSRLPVYEERIDHIVGTIFAKDLLRYLYKKDTGAAPSLSQVMREPVFVPESKQLSEVFKDLKRTKNHMAIIIDEYGGTAGLVTMEDILEEIVGEIQDEFDSEEAIFVEKGLNIFDVSGSVSISDFVEYFDLDEEFELEVEGDVETIAGWMTQLLGDLPEVGQTVNRGFLTIEVIDVARHRIDKIRVTRKKAISSAPN